MQYSPKLKKAMEEIKKILSKYDIAAFCVLHTPGHSEYLLNVDTSYSCARIDPATGYLRVRAKLVEDFKGNKEAWTLKVTDTANMLSLLSEVGGRTVLSLMDISKQVDAAVNAEHFGKGHTGATAQNN